MQYPMNPVECHPSMLFMVNPPECSQPCKEPNPRSPQQMKSSTTMKQQDLKQKCPETKQYFARQYRSAEGEDPNPYHGPLVLEFLSMESHMPHHLAGPGNFNPDGLVPSKLSPMTQQQATAILTYLRRLKDNPLGSMYQ